MKVIQKEDPKDKSYNQEISDPYRLTHLDAAVVQVSKPVRNSRH